jgi:CheY-like chemotaxis protein
MTQEPLRLLIVEDIKSLSQMFVSALQKSFPGAQLDAVETLTQARDALRSNAYDAVVTDCGFPESDIMERLHGNRNGITLMSEIRRGAYGTYNKNTPIAFNSAEMDADKRDAAERIGGNTKSFRKGSYYPGIRIGTNEQNFNVENVTGESVRWLKEELAEDKVAQRRADVEEQSVPTKANWRSWFSGGKGGQQSRSRR